MQQEKEYASIRNSVDLDISVNDLFYTFDRASKIIEYLNNIENKDELHKELLKIKEHLTILQKNSKEYDDSVLKNNPSITEEKLSDEKKKYLTRRRIDSIDWC